MKTPIRRTSFIVLIIEAIMLIAFGAAIFIWHAIVKGVVNQWSPEFSAGFAIAAFICLGLGILASLYDRPRY